MDLMQTWKRKKKSTQVYAMETVTGFELYQNQWVYCSKQVRRTRLLDCSTFMNTTYWWKSWKVLAAKTGSSCKRNFYWEVWERAVHTDSSQRLPWLISALLAANQDLVQGLGVSQSSSWSFCKSLFHSALLSECQSYVPCTYSCCLCWALGVLVLFWLQIKIWMQVISSSWASQIGE